MTDPCSALSDDVALRIGLAARALPDTDAARLLEVLADAVGLPPTLGALDTLTVKRLKTAADGALAELDTSALKDALAYLKGENGIECEPPPTPEPYAPGDLPGSIRVACASNGGERLDGHFGACRRFLIYQVSAAGYRLIDCRDADTGPGPADDKNDARAARIADCDLLYVVGIGGPAAAKVVKRDIHPIKQPGGGDARHRIAALSRLLADKPPPWLAKAMGREAEARVRFARDADVR